MIAAARSVFGNAKLQTRWYVWLGSGIVIALALNLILRLLPRFPDYYAGYIIYPFVVYANSLQIFLYIVYAAILSCLLFSLSRNRSASNLLSVGLLFVILFLSCGNCFVSLVPSRQLAHRSSIEYKGHQYHLAVSYGNSNDLDATVGHYLVYECDPTGLICQKFFIPDTDYGVGQQEVGTMLNEQVSLFMDPANGKMYLRYSKGTFEIYNNQSGP